MQSDKRHKLAPIARALGPVRPPSWTLGVSLASAITLSAGAFALATAATPGAIPSPDQIAERQAEQAAPRNAISIDPAVLDAYVGYYQLFPDVVFTVTRDGTTLFASLSGQGPVAWLPESQTKFFARVVHAQISFATDGKGAASELVLHQGGFEQSAKRISEDKAKDIEAARERRIATKAQAPGTEAVLRLLIPSLAQGQPIYDDINPPLAALVRQQLPQTSAKIQQMGALQSIAFRTVSPQDLDVYDVQFEHAKTEWRLAPLTDDGRITMLTWREVR